MAGSKLVLPANGAADWSGWVTAVERVWRGYMQVSLSNMTGSAESVLQAGSAVEMGGSLYQFTSDEAVTTGWSAITTATTAYMKFVPASTEVAWEYTAVAPVWDDDKQGFYGTSGSATHRYFGQLLKNGTTTHEGKSIYKLRKDDLQEKIQEMGDWDMNTSSTKYVPHGISNWKNIRGIQAIIRNDDDDTYRHQVFFWNALGDDDMHVGIQAIDNTNITISRRGAGHFDASAYNATGFNRGWVVIWYTL